MTLSRRGGDALADRCKNAAQQIDLALTSKMAHVYRLETTPKCSFCDMKQPEMKQKLAELQRHPIGRASRNQPVFAESLLGCVARPALQAPLGRLHACLTTFALCSPVSIAGATTPFWSLLVLAGGSKQSDARTQTACRARLAGPTASVSSPSCRRTSDPTAIPRRLTVLRARYCRAFGLSPP